MRIYRSFFREIIISTNSPLEYLEFDARIVTDIHRGKGPLGGIHAGLLHAEAEQAFVSACDMPYLSEAFIAHMIAKAGGYDLVVPVSAKGFEPLHAIYSRRCLPVIESQIERGELKLAPLFREVQDLRDPRQRDPPVRPRGAALHQPQPAGRPGTDPAARNTPLIPPDRPVSPSPGQQNRRSLHRPFFHLTIPRFFDNSGAILRSSDRETQTDASHSFSCPALSTPKEGGFS